MPTYFTKSLTVTLADGSKKRLKFRGKTEREAERKLEDARIKLANGLLVVNSRTTFADWVQEWQETYARPVMNTRNYAARTAMLANYFLPEIGNIRLCDLRTIHLQRCANAFSGMSKSQVNKARIVIGEVLRQAKANKLISDDLLSAVSWPQGYEKESRALNQEERERFLHAYPNHPFGLLFAVTYFCGLRPGEVRALTWRDVDFQQGIITVRNAVKCENEEIGAPKSRTGKRIVPLPQELAQQLMAHPKTGIFIFAGEDGKPISREKYNLSWREIMRLMYREAGLIRPTKEQKTASGMSDLTAYHLRHTYATRLVEKGVDIKTVQYLMGHSDISMTAKYYTHVTPLMLENARQKIESSPL